MQILRKEGTINDCFFLKRKKNNKKLNIFIKKFAHVVKNQYFCSRKSLEKGAELGKKSYQKGVEMI